MGCDPVLTPQEIYDNYDLTNGRSEGRYDAKNYMDCATKCSNECRCQVAVFDGNKRRCYLKSFRSYGAFAQYDPKQNDDAISRADWQEKDGWTTMLIRSPLATTPRPTSSRDSTTQRPSTSRDYTTTERPSTSRSSTESTTFGPLTANPECPSTYDTQWNVDAVNGRELDRLTVGSREECTNECEKNCDCNVNVYDVDNRRCYLKDLQDYSSFDFQNSRNIKELNTGKFSTQQLREIPERPSTTERPSTSRDSTTQRPSTSGDDSTTERPSTSRSSTESTTFGPLTVNPECPSVNIQIIDGDISNGRQIDRLSVRSFDECRNECEKRCDCDAAAFDGKVGRCYLKDLRSLNNLKIKQAGTMRWESVLLTRGTFPDLSQLAAQGSSSSANSQSSSSSTTIIVGVVAAIVGAVFAAVVIRKRQQKNTQSEDVLSEYATTVV